MKIVFMGTPQPAVPTLEALLSEGHDVVAVWTQPDRSSGRGQKPKFPPVKEYALEMELPVYQPEKIRTSESKELFRSHDADVAVVVAYGRILTTPYLTAFRHGAINVHFSLLPKYRGAAPVNWAIVNGESNTGVTTMKMDRGLDTGDILLQASTEIDEEENAVGLMERLSFLGARILVKTLNELDDLVPVRQDERFATLAPMLAKEDGQINWEMPALDISNRIRGFQPFPKSFASLGEKRVTFWKARPVSGSRPSVAIPGRITTDGKEELLVGCGDNSILRIDELQLEGKRRMTARDFLNGTDLADGDSFR